MRKYAPWVAVGLVAIGAVLFATRHRAATPSHKLGSMAREFAFAAGTNMSVGTVDNANGTQTVTYTNTSTANVSSVTGGTNISCSPTTGAVTCSYTGAAGGVTSVTGSGLVSCSPTSGAVTCSATTPVSLANGGTGANLSAACTTSTQVVQPNGTGGLGCVSTLGAPSGGTGVASPTAHSVPITEGASAFNLVASTTIGKVFHANGAGNDPGFTSWTMADPGTAGEVLTSDGTNWVSKPQSSQWNDSGGNVSLTGTGTFFTIATIVVTDITTTSFVLVWGQMECHVGTTPTSCTYCISIDSTTTCTSNQHSVTANNGSDSGGGIVYRAFSLSAGAHTFRLMVAESAHASVDSAAGDIMAMSVGN